MATTDTKRQDLWAEYERLFSPGHKARLKARGWDMVEGERTQNGFIKDDGTPMLDCYSGAGAFNLGRKRAELAQELSRAAHATDQGNFPMISIEKAQLGKELSVFVNHGLECALFGVVRGESMEAACKIARGYTGRKKLVTPDGGWYGETGFAMSLSTRPDKSTYGPLIPDTINIPFGDIAAAARVIDRDTAALILEPIQAENHCRQAAPDYLEALAALCKKQGALLILDETQSGFGRSGKRFAFEHARVNPDILVVGEALGGGMFPITATLLTQKVNRFLNRHPLIHLSTFGGSDIGCRVAVAALDIYNREQPWQQAATLGASLKQAINALDPEKARIRSVAGAGLLLSLELPSRAAATALCRQLSRNGVLAAPGRVAPRCVLLRPSLTITENDIDTIVAALSKSLSELEETPA